MPRSELQTLLRDRFGHREFRPGQERLIRDALAGRDVLAVLPTGGGKSLVYQLAAQLLDGVTLVVSPLLALMQDQVEALEERSIPVTIISSMQTTSEIDEDLRELQAGQARLLYVTPERFDDQDFLADLRRLHVSLLVVDEAHSISEWGHSFRPAYLALGQAIELIGRPTVLALTATASPLIRKEIIERLRLRDPDIVVQGIDRPNLSFEVVRVEDERAERSALEALFVNPSEGEPLRGSGIVYTATTRAAEETARWLAEWGISADFYHGQRRKAERAHVQAAFMDGQVQVIAATNAFGLGVDKPDVRFVVHRDVPPSIEAYFQEAGRAGRDGEPARCILVYRPADLGRAAFLNGTGALTREEVRVARRGLLRRRAGTLTEMARAAKLGRADFLRLVDLLQRQGALRVSRGRLQMLVDDFDADAVPLDREEARQAYERSRLEMMRSYAETRDCRRHFLLGYFGEEYPSSRCGNCDNDRARSERATSDGSSDSVMIGGGAEPQSSGGPGPSGATAVQGPFAVHDRVRHASWGEGVVHRLSGDTLTVLFERAGYKTLALDLVLEQGLLERV
ncbi:MAG: ATP-dependent DNA helicase [Chloroflexota bacterium]|nr:ATP-dependent DNA helicase [Chloroflexota bacterium]